MFHGLAVLYYIANLISYVTYSIACSRCLYAQAQERSGCNFWSSEGGALYLGRRGVRSLVPFQQNRYGDRVGHRNYAMGKFHVRFLDVGSLQQTWRPVGLPNVSYG